MIKKEAPRDIHALGGAGGAILVTIMILFFNHPNVNEVLAGFKTISDSETKSLVGLTTSELRQRLGKPDDVEVREYALLLESLDNTKHSDEIWRYYRKVAHESSGTKMSLSCSFRKGTCTAVDVY